MLKKEDSIDTFKLLGFQYRISYDEFLSLNDFYLDFRLLKFCHSGAIEKCDSESLVKHINNNYKNTEPLKRLSAKIIATDDPVLTMQGVPGL